MPPYDQDDDGRRDDLDFPDTRARVFAAFIIIFLAMIGFAAVLAALVRAL